MAARKTATRKKKAPARKRRAPQGAGVSATEEAKFRRQNDLRTLQEAEAIRTDGARLGAAKREATDQRRALDKIAGKK